MKYDKTVARQLVQSMDVYENNILKCTRNLHGDAKSPYWKDKKHNDFCRELSSVVQDIKNGSYTIRDYKNHLDQKIRELG